MKFSEVKKVSLLPFRDERGFFEETFRASSFPCSFVQDNHSFSKKGVIRGMHFQSFPGQAKLVQVIQGEIFDVVVDIRKQSPTKGQWDGVYLTAHEQLWIPVGFAHGFCVVSNEAHVIYKVSSYYEPACEKTFRFDDPFIGIKWPESHPILSDKDLNAPLFCEVVE